MSKRDLNLVHIFLKNIGKHSLLTRDEELTALLMDAADVFDNLLEKCDPLDHILPTNERQVRPLTKLEPQQQQDVWQPQ